MKTKRVKSERKRKKAEKMSKRSEIKLSWHMFLYICLRMRGRQTLWASFPFSSFSLIWLVLQPFYSRINMPYIHILGNKSYFYTENLIIIMYENVNSCKCVLCAVFVCLLTTNKQHKTVWYSISKRYTVYTFSHTCDPFSQTFSPSLSFAKNKLFYFSFIIIMLAYGS